MPNMSYCRFENTFGDLQDCFENMDNDLSRDEFEYRKKLVRLCMNIANGYADILDEKFKEEAYDNED